MDNIKQILDEQERSAAWLARKIGISRQALHDEMKTGKYPPGRKFKIAEILHRHPHEVFPEPALVEVQR